MQKLLSKLFENDKNIKTFRQFGNKDRKKFQIVFSSPNQELVPLKKMIMGKIMQKLLVFCTKYINLSLTIILRNELK